MKTKSAVAFFLAMLLVALTACGTATAPGGENPIRIAAVNAMELQSPRDEENPAARAVAAGANDFAFRLSAALAKNAGDENFVCSPYSVWLPLAALANATKEQSKAALLSALGAAGMAETDTNEAASRMLYDLTQKAVFRMSFDLEEAESKEEEYYNPLKIVNAVFVDDDVTLQKDFAQTFMDYYRGNAINVDFSSPDAVDAVNRWASENTDGLITNLIQSFHPETVAAIASAMYFSDRWEREFREDQTAEDRFHAPAGDTTAFYMRRTGDSLPYYEDGKVQAMPLGFMNGGGMYIILPKTGTAGELLSSMTNAYFNEIQRNAALATGTLLLPRFSIESNFMGLQETLEQLGVPLFDEEAAPLTGGLIEEDRPVCLSKAVHKAVIHVDEKGTTAAAATVMPATPTAGMPEPTEPFEMNCNKPFVFVLYDRTLDGGAQVLFTGIVNQP